MRINKFIAEMTGISRREADELIENGKVTLDNTIATLGQHVEKSSKVTVNGTEVTHTTPYSYIMLHKPIGYVSSRAQQDDAPTLYTLLPSEHQSLKTVGRLDKDSSGLILITNDGDFTHHYTHPKFTKQKQYTVELNTPLTDEKIEALKSGIKLKDGSSSLQVRRTTDDKTYKIIMHEGRNRQIRRTFAAIGSEVITLHRTAMGEYLLDDLAPGEYKKVTPLN